MSIAWIYAVIIGVIVSAKIYEWWIINIMLTKYKFDGKGHIVRKN